MSNLTIFQEPQPLARHVRRQLSQSIDEIQFTREVTEALQREISRIYANGSCLSIGTVTRTNALIQVAVVNGMLPDQAAMLQQHQEQYLAIMGHIAAGGAHQLATLLENLPELPEPNPLDRLERLITG
jgi:nucleoid-associated protein YejK